MGPILAQSAGLRIGAFDDKAEFQEFEQTNQKPTSTSTCRQCERLAEMLAVADFRNLQGSLGWITQLSDGWRQAFAELDVELDRSNTVFVNT